MISGENMKKTITVKQKHRYTKETNLMYRGAGEFERKNDCIKLNYLENNKPMDVQVEVTAYHDHMELKRTGELVSHLNFVPKQKTKGTLTSEYGDIDIDLFTYKYIRKDNVITLEYDIMNGDEVSGGYHIIWNIKEE